MYVLSPGAWYLVCAGQTPFTSLVPTAPRIQEDPELGPRFLKKVRSDKQPGSLAARKRVLHCYVYGPVLYIFLKGYRGGPGEYVEQGERACECPLSLLDATSDLFRGSSVGT